MRPPGGRQHHHGARHHAPARQYRRVALGGFACTAHCCSHNGPARVASGGRLPAPRTGAERVDVGAQRARDSDARAILDAELRRAQERLAEAQKAYASGEPEKLGAESRNHQRYLDRVTELKATVTRAQADVDSLRRELARFGASLNASAAP